MAESKQTQEFLRSRDKKQMQESNVIFAPKISPNHKHLKVYIRSLAVSKFNLHVRPIYTPD